LIGRPHDRAAELGCRRGVGLPAWAARVEGIDSAEDRTGMSTPVMIEADGLCKQFGSFLAVRDVSFTIHKG
jgi:hypothetical protein